MMPWEDPNLPRDCCPMCGYEFSQEEILAEDVEVTCPRCKESSDKDSLITEWDDSAWDRA